MKPEIKIQMHLMVDGKAAYVWGSEETHDPGQAFAVCRLLTEQAHDDLHVQGPAGCATAKPVIFCLTEAVKVALQEAKVIAAYDRVRRRVAAQGDKALREWDDLSDADRYEWRQALLDMLDPIVR